MSNIIPITKATKKMKPPLRKTELIEALAIRELQKIKEEQAELVPQIAAAKAAFYSQTNLQLLIDKGEMRKEYNGDLFDEDCEYKDGKRHVLSIKAEISLSATPEMKRQFRKWKDLEAKQLNVLPSLAELKRGIRIKMDGQPGSSSDRVYALLNDPATLKALDATLEAISKPALPALPSSVAV